MAKGKDPRAGTAKIKRVGIWKANFVAICRSKKHGNVLTLRDSLAAHGYVFESLAHGCLYRPVKAEQFTDRQGRDGWITRQQLPLVRILAQGEQPIAQQMRCGAVPGSE